MLVASLQNPVPLIQWGIGVESAVGAEAVDSYMSTGEVGPRFELSVQWGGNRKNSELPELSEETDLNEQYQAEDSVFEELGTAIV